MAMRCCPELVRVALVAMIMAGLELIASPPTAPPRPSFDVSRSPKLFFNVSPADVNDDGITELS